MTTVTVVYIIGYFNFILFCTFLGEVVKRIKRITTVLKRNIIILKRVCNVFYEKTTQTYIFIVKNVYLQPVFSQIKNNFMNTPLLRRLYSFAVFVYSEK